MKVDPVTLTPLSERLQQAKRDLGLSVRRAVAAAHRGGHEISTYTVTQALNGKHGHVTPKTVQALAHAFQVPYRELAELAGLAERHGAFKLAGKTAEYADALTRTQADAVIEVMRLLAEGNRRQDPSPIADSEQEDYDLAASYGDEGIGPDELPEGGP